MRTFQKMLHYLKGLILKCTCTYHIYHTLSPQNRSPRFKSGDWESGGTTCNNFVLIRHIAPLPPPLTPANAWLVPYERRNGWDGESYRGSHD